VLYLTVFQLVRRASNQLRRSAELEQQALREREQRFRALVANANDLIVILTPAGDLRYRSPTAERAWGQADGPGGTGFLDQVCREDLDAARQLLAQALASPGTNLTTELRLQTADSGQRDFEVIVSN